MKNDIPLEEIKRLIFPNDDSTLLVYVTPAQRLRNEANKLEQDEIDRAVVAEWLNKMGKG